MVRFLLKVPAWAALGREVWARVPVLSDLWVLARDHVENT